jgi:hypothetical protein
MEKSDKLRPSTPVSLRRDAVNRWVGGLRGAGEVKNSDLSLSHPATLFGCLRSYSLKRKKKYTFRVIVLLFNHTKQNYVSLIASFNPRRPSVRESTASNWEELLCILWPHFDQTYLIGKEFLQSEQFGLRVCSLIQSDIIACNVLTPNRTVRHSVVQLKRSTLSGREHTLWQWIEFHSIL